ncbi:aminotransferase class V-fold PLP-dependent enzyme [Winogradskyella sp. A3E31]|uniref:aminotransferase class V-fold PLP-dependent enzyme n=1 Tax=Winogradskyella sp. A3E31 TaxID=3349637 RepID=UPI00398A9606
MTNPSLQHKKHLFDIPDDITYFNTASLSPSFKSVELAGIDALRKKSRPYLIPSSDFFDPVTELKHKFASIIDCDESNRVVTTPSVSYGLATVANNIRLKSGDEIVLIEEQFPSNYYIWKKLAQRFDAKIVTIKQPEDKLNCGKLWNDSILEAITDKTAVVAMGQIHWSNGILFDLKAIRKKTKDHNALLIVDGSQSIGALPFSIKDIQPDALVCAGYKWLFGPYGCAYAYYGSYFDGGNPIEENWSNRLHSENLKGLTNYQSKYKPLANRYAMGESGSFIYVKMQIEALNQVSKFKPEYLQDYCDSISKDACNELQQLGFFINDSESRAKHLFGVELPEGLDSQRLKSVFQENNIYVSYRGNYLRLSCHLFNTKTDFERLVKAVKEVL